MSATKLCVFGEVLFDVFSPQQRVMGGAPFNVAWHLNAFGASPHLISRVGEDDDGDHIRAVMQQHDFDTSGIQTDTLHPTGKVNVLIEDDEPEYDIVFPSAFDFIEDEPEMESMSFLYHGSLALRHQVSEEALNALYAKKPGTVFLDVNLRAPWWKAEKVTQYMQKADWLKLNTDELDLLQPSQQSITQRVRSMIDSYQLSGLVLTNGGEGASVFSSLSDDVHTVKPEQNNSVVDTVGAGDAFTAVFIFGMLNQWPVPDTLDRAQQFASRIVQQRGAIITDKTVYSDFLKHWGVLQ